MRILRHVTHREKSQGLMSSCLFTFGLESSFTWNVKQGKITRSIRTCVITEPWHFGRNSSPLLLWEWPRCIVLRELARGCIHLLVWVISCLQEATINTSANRWFLSDQHVRPHKLDHLLNLSMEPLFIKYASPRAPSAITNIVASKADFQVEVNHLCHEHIYVIYANEERTWLRQMREYLV